MKTIKQFKQEIIAAAITILVLGGAFYGFWSYRVAVEIEQKIHAAEAESDLPLYTSEMLAEYDATDPEKPILIGLDGYVYDVTEGKRFYELGAGYHYLTGKDSSADLAIAGGDIIKRKYPIVGRLE